MTRAGIGRVAGVVVVRLTGSGGSAGEAIQSGRGVDGVATPRLLVACHACPCLYARRPGPVLSCRRHDAGLVSGLARRLSRPSCYASCCASRRRCRRVGAACGRRPSRRDGMIPVGRHGHVFCRRRGHACCHRRGPSYGRRRDVFARHGPFHDHCRDPSPCSYPALACHHDRHRASCRCGRPFGSRPAQRSAKPRRTAFPPLIPGSLV